VVIGAKDHPNLVPKLLNGQNADTVIKNVTILCALKILGLFNIFPARITERVQGPALIRS
jgi:hypothetical protein